MLETMTELQGELLVEGYFQGPFTYDLQSTKGQPHGIFLGETDIPTLRRYKECIGALLITEADLRRHSTIFAKTLGVPVLLLSKKPSLAEGEQITLGKSKQQNQATRMPTLVKTADGVPVRLYIAASCPGDVWTALEQKLPIGLLRTEFLGEQANALYALCGQASYAACRLFDFSGDKENLATTFDSENRKNLQIVNILEASNARCAILIPCVETPQQMQEYRMYIDGYGKKTSPPLGAMLETEEAFGESGGIMAVSDFCVIGMNTMQRLGYSAKVMEVRCKVMVEAAQRQGLPLYACGELTEELARLLVRCGIFRLILPPSAWKQVTKAIQHCKYFD